jgi:AraC-like DNA-binding protein
VSGRQGLTPHRYRVVNQLEKAKRELIQSHKSVTNIAFDCGFSSLGTFSLMFKNYVGSSPRSYRDQYCYPYSACQIPVVHDCFALMLGLPNSNF